MASLIQKITASISAPLFAFGIGCSIPKEDGRCGSNFFGDTMCTFSSVDGRYDLTVTIMHSGGAIHELQVRGAKIDGEANCFYRIQRDLYGTRLLEQENCPPSLTYHLSNHFEAGMDRALRISQ